VLILPPGHAQRVLAPRRLSRREKWILASVLSTVAALALIVVISLGTADHKSGKGCIDVTAPGFVGSQEVSGCGARARAICNSVGTGGGYSRGQDAVVAAECRKQRIPVGG
jgi:hypothetical protein